MVEATVDIKEQQIEPKVIEEKEAEKERINLVDIYTEEGIREFGKALQGSNGSCLVLVHAFDPFFPPEGYQPDYSFLEQPKHKKLKDYVDRLKRIILRVQAEDRRKKLPILAMVRAEVGQMRRGKGENIERAKKRLARDMKKLVDLKDQRIFFIVTHQSAPIPLLTGQDENKYRLKSGSPDYEKIMVKFVERLKETGLKRAVFAGTNFGGGQYFESRYWEAEFPPISGPFRKSKWKLRDYYQKRRGTHRWEHPFELISPEGCVATAIRAFAYCDVNVGVTQATYPQRMPKSSQIERFRKTTSHFEVKPRPQK